MKKLFFTLVLLINFPMAFSQSEGPKSPIETLRNRLSGHISGAHQGGLLGGPWPNTMAAFEKAYADGVDVVEMDLHLTKDGVVVVYHDDELDTWTKCKGLISDKTFEEVKACRFKLSSKAVIPTFEEVLKWSLGKVIIDAEFKDMESIQPAILLVQKYQAQSWTYFQAQDVKEKYIAAHNFDPSISLLYIIQNSKEDLDWALAQSANLMIIEVNQETRTPEVLEKIHASGKLASEDSWHFSKSRELFSATCKETFENNVDIAISNRPKECAEQK